ncbi:MAG TPA: hypothetical protein PKD17_06055 [Cellvibrionaceae bacterium]|nr:hypothetical protein [Cellvibrionaceae bacterium]HMW71362.1 hypothetical protein [Cellvibrionaceae bacterium]HMY37796.1 hypothetical protein [Marinagarivorans sp.]HNG58793.1 hypothetical protein [Cellvibrionaceae bacterium]
MRYVAAIIVNLLCLNISAEAQTQVLCLDKIVPASAEINPAIKMAGWDVLVSDMPIWLTNISVYDGPVVQNAALVPNAKKNKEEYWDFKNHPGALFLSCEYANGAFKLTKPLPAGVTACKASVKKSSSTGMLQGGFICW